MALKIFLWAIPSRACVCVYVCACVRAFAFGDGVICPQLVGVHRDFCAVCAVNAHLWNDCTVAPLSLC